MREKSLIVWIVLIAALLAVLNLPDSVSGKVKAAFRDVLAPLQSGVSTLTQRTRERIQSLRGYGRLLKENEKMSVQLALLRNEVRSLKSLQDENAQLRRYLRFEEQSSRQLMACNVIGRDLTGWWQTVRLGKGSVDGIERDMAVITPEGLVGRTIDVSVRTADVLLITDPGCKVSARISRTGSFGVLSGRGIRPSGAGGCELDFINKNVAVQAGDEVVTSGLGGVFPKGLLIGYADKVVADESGLFQRTEVVPSADIGRLQYVFVVIEASDPVEQYLRRAESQEEGEP
jgi:rod shape-determining protein MreC